MTRLMERGFTLIELMVTLVIVAILVGIAMPRFRSVSEQVNFTSVQQSLTSSLFLARSESVKRGVDVGVCASNDGQSCSNPRRRWNQGWIIYTDLNRNSVYNAGTDELLRYNEVELNLVIKWSHNRTIVFEADGSVTDISSGSFKICDLGASTATPKGVLVSLSGRIRTTDSVTCP